MSKPKLTPAMQVVLGRMKKADDWQSSYVLRTSLGTLRAMQKRRIVDVRGYDKPRAFSMPQIMLEWRIVPAYRKTLEE